MGESKPIKRSEQLKPLSRDHHEGLLLGWKIRQGMKKGVSLERINEYVHWFWEHHLAEHFRQEENVFGKFVDANDEGLQRMLKEHKMIKNLALKNNKEEELSQLDEIVTNHIRFEEREFFPHVESMLSADQLNEAASLLQKESSHPDIWQDEFWTGK
jgi:hypothetical protein